MRRGATDSVCRWLVVVVLFALFDECRQERARSRLATAMRTVSGYPLAIAWRLAAAVSDDEEEQAITKPVSASCGRALGARLIKGFEYVVGWTDAPVLDTVPRSMASATSLALAALLPCFWLRFPGPYTRPFPTHVHPLSTHSLTPSTHPPPSRHHAIHPNQYIQRERARARARAISRPKPRSPAQHRAEIS